MTRLVPLPSAADAGSLRPRHTGLYPPVPLREHKVETAFQRGWDKLKNGDLLKAGEEAGFEVLVTPDKNMRYQQHLKNYRIAIVVLGNPRWPVLRHYVDRVEAAVNAAKRGTCCEVEIPEG